MTIYNLGSINIDHVYRVPHLPAPGETLTSSDFTSGLGGKGANQSIAVRRAGGDVHHIGAVGPEGDWAVEGLRAADVDVSAVATLDTPTGHAIINVDDDGENAIVLFPGANRAISEAMIEAALDGAGDGDWLLLQNETNLGVYAAQTARTKGMRVAYSAAPFDADAVAEILPLTDLLAVNEIEAAQLSRTLGKISVPLLLVTKGDAGAVLHGDPETSAPAFKVTPVDTTGAGDTFLGYFMAGLDAGDPAADALRRASAAAAIQVTRHGAAVAIPIAEEVAKFLKDHA